MENGDEHHPSSHRHRRDWTLLRPPEPLKLYDLAEQLVRGFCLPEEGESTREEDDRQISDGTSSRQRLSKRSSSRFRSEEEDDDDLVWVETVSGTKRIVRLCKALELFVVCVVIVSGAVVLVSSSPLLQTSDDDNNNNVLRVTNKFHASLPIFRLGRKHAPNNSLLHNRQDILYSKLCKDRCENDCWLYQTPLQRCYNGQSLFPEDSSWGNVDVFDTLVDDGMLIRRFFDSDSETCGGDATDTFALPLNECIGPFGEPRPWGVLSLTEPNT